MNHAYAYNRQETSAMVINRIYYLMNTHGWSIKTLSDESNIPYETLKKLLNRKIENTSIHNIIKIAAALQCNIDFLLGSDQAPPGTESLSIHSQNILSYLKQVDSSLSDSSGYHEGTLVPIYIPDSLFKEEHSSFSGMENMLDIGSYPDSLRKEITCGVLIQSHCYHPIFYSQDILLVAQNHIPPIGEIGIFMHEGYFYIRKFYPHHNQTILKPVNGIGRPICVKDFSDWHIYGTVIGVHRPLQQ